MKDLKGYIDLYVLPVPKKHLTAYRRIANEWGEIMRDHGVLEYREWLAHDLHPKGLAAFPSKIKLKPGEVLISSVVEFHSKEHRDQVNKRALNDPRMIYLIAKKPLFNMKRMLYGGFVTIVKMRKRYHTHH
jgi:uncharacterized protein YbaA (DUF1428 family)